MKKLLLFNLFLSFKLLGAEIPAASLPVGIATNGNFLIGINNAGQTRLFPVTNVIAVGASIPNTFTGIFANIVMTNNSYTIIGATGIHTNSANTGVDFSGANQSYVWCDTCKGNAIGTTTNTGLFRGVSDSTWVLSYQYYSPALYPAWIVYNTNTWSYSGSVGTNSVLRGGSDNGTPIQPTHTSNYLPDLGQTNLWYYVPDTANSAVKLVPNYTTNTVNGNALVSDAVSSILHFPHVGSVQTSVRRANVHPPFGIFSTDIQGNGIIKITSGAGVLRGIEIMPSQFVTGNLRSNYFLQIFPDYGNNSTTFASVNSNYMTFNVPITSLASCKWDNTNTPTGLQGLSYSTEYVDVNTGDYKTPTASPIIKINLKLPCPFTNGIFIRVIDQLNQTELSSQFYSTVNYEIDPTGQLNYPYRTWRLHGGFTRFSCIEPNAQGASDWTKTQITMFSATNCSGVLLGVWAGLDGLNGPVATSGLYQYPMETANWEFICDGQYPPVLFEGEDFFFTPYECYLPPPILQRTHGLVNRLGTPSPAFPTSIDAYRQFTSDYQVFWFNSVSAVVSIGSPGTAFTGDIATIYYSNP